MKKMTTKDFIVKAKIVHGLAYTYSKSVYTTSKSKLLIECPVHGEFEQTANSHLSGRGCRACAIVYRASIERQSKEEYVEKALIKHNNFYSYHNLTYTGVHAKGTITCPIHGDFDQVLNAHLGGQGCRECAKSHLGNSYSAFKNKRTILYVIQLGDSAYKVGITRRTVQERYYGDTTGPYKVLFQVSFFDGAEAFAVEHSIMTALRNNKYLGKRLLKRTKNYEIFNINPVLTIESIIINKFYNSNLKVPVLSN